MKRTLLGVSLAGLALLGGCGGGSSSSSGGTTSTTNPNPPTPALAFRTIDQGSTSGFSTSPASSSSQQVVGSDSAWATLWNDHQSINLPPAALPAVDFSSERVAALFLGQRPSTGYAISVVAVSEKSGAIEVEYTTSQPSGAAGAQITNPFHIVAINRVQGAIRFRDVTPPPTSTPVTGLHGTLVATPAGTAQPLAFQEDGAAGLTQLTDVSALRNAGAHAGTTLTVSGDVLASQALDVTRFELDDVQAGGRVNPGTGVATFTDNEQRVFEPTGPLAAALAAVPATTPVFLTGRSDPNAATANPQAVALEVTSWHATEDISIRVAGGLLGLTDTFTVDDLVETGASRHRIDYFTNFIDPQFGRGRLNPSDLSSLRAAITAANLPAQPSTFRPQFPIADAPATTLTFADARGVITITMLGGSNPPPELQALVMQLNTLKQGLTKARDLEQGAMSGVTQAGTQVIRDDAGFQALWAQHAPGSTPPQVDFQNEIVIAAFMGQQSTGGYAIRFATQERVGDDVYLTVERTVPTGIVTQVITSPFHVVSIDLGGARGDVFVDGVRQ